MNTPTWTRSGLTGAGIGAVAVAILGFTWGGWVTASKAEVLAANRARAEVIAVLAPICVMQAKADPASTATIAKLKDTSRYARTAIVIDAGWATMPGADSADNGVASACMDKLAESF